MLNSVMSEGARGLQLSQREMQKAASDIARANITDNPQQQVNRPQPSTLAPVNETRESSQRGVEESLIELRRQEQLFNASAQVVSTGSETLGTLIDTKS